MDINLNKIEKILNSSFIRSGDKDILNTAKKTIDVDKTMYINGTFDRASANDTARTVDISFASEVPYLRWFGWEIIDLKTMDFSRLNNKAVLLFNHDWDDYIGVIEKAWVGADNRGYATVRFDTHEKADKIFQSVKSGILPGVSFGYEITKAWEVQSLDTTEAFRVSTLPFEISIVTIPADPTVGYGRLKNKDIEKREIEITVIVNENNDNQNDCLEVIEVPIEEIIEGLTDFKEGENNPEENKLPKVEEKLDIQNEISNNINNNNIDIESKKYQNVNISINKLEKKMDRNEINAKIAKLGRQYGATDMALDFIEKDNVTVEDFTEALLSKRSAGPSIQNPSVTEYEKEDYSLGLALKQLMSGNVSGIVKEVNQEMERKHGERRAENSILIPFNALKRDVTAGNAASAGNLVPNTLSMSPIDSLYNSLAIVQAGATYMTDLVGTVDIPRFNNIITAQYVGENVAATGSSLATDLVQLSGKDLTANIDISRKMRLQTPYNIQALCADQLFQAIRHKMDLDALIGTGASNQVRGVLNQTGVGSVVTGGTLDWQDVLNLEAQVKSKNALLSKGAYISTSKIEALMKGTQKGSGIGFIYENGKVNDYDLYTTNGLPEVGTTTKTSSLAFGDWSQLLVGNWGAIELQYDPYTNSKTGQNSLTIFVTYDTAVRHAQSFSVASDITVV